MTDTNPDIVVLRKGTEGLSAAAYAEEIRERLPNYEIAHAQTRYQEQELIERARVATGISLDEELVERAKELELFVVAASGYNHLPMEVLSDKGVVVSNAAGIHAPGIAEQALGYCLSFARRLHEGWERKQHNEWRHYKATEFTGSTVTVVGLGAIGQAFVQRLQGMEVHTIGVRYTPEKGGSTDEVIGFEEREFHEALSQTDYLLLSTPLTDVTRNLIDTVELATLPAEAVVINVCRGAVVNTDALLSSIQKEDIRGAAMDVTDPEPLPPDHPLWNMRNVFITPHMGGHTPKHWERLADILEENIRNIDSKKFDCLPNQVNNPNVLRAAERANTRPTN